MPPKLVVDGNLTVPLFHGTSTLFYSSILKTGLGGRDLLSELGLAGIIRELLKYEDQLETISNWSFEKTYLLKIAAGAAIQNPTGRGIFNFRYGGTYVTPSKQTAATYAQLYDCGSEALTCTLKILNALIAQLPRLAGEEPFCNVLAFANKPRSPVVIEARDVPKSYLRSEQGGPCDRVLESIESALSDPDIYDILVQQSNFELTSPIPASHLRCYRIVQPTSGHESLESLKLEPL